MLAAHSGIQVVDTAKNGKEAVAKVKQLKPDVVTMDVEMPEMDGITALKLIMAENPCQVVMLSSLTRRSAAVTLEALALGAVDYMEKDARAWVADSATTGMALVDKIIALGGRKQTVSRPLTPMKSEPEHVSNSKIDAVPEVEIPVSVDTLPKFPDCKIVTIGSSTGGPAALQTILTGLPGDFPVPVLLTQHMPKAFTTVFARRLNDLCAIKVKEAEDGDQLLPGCAYLAPGGQQMIIDPLNAAKLIIRESDERMTYKPSVDLTFASVAKGYGSRVLAIVLTGMGADGCDGARMLKKAGARVWAQDKDSSTIFGMPKAVITAELADAVLNIDNIRQTLTHWGQR
ncbi:protein-glutamate methylesterase/protein-glutamine glutaminase [Amphritea japonica]|uniref:Protein-glutamate methylesterase/protein-glutamine glutaminase n=2 Tax=Amphritea TaxID=515417 RepID=A0A7R6P9S2_9GAMM|nr:chemotaxis response regulator protein-glutamate methylesterase [Amphritea japonica]BBB25191.1 two-component system, chemotaxis family, response regulator CheB [Amphritea japonica ATCC BAA-1530]